MISILVSKYLYKYVVAYLQEINFFARLSNVIIFISMWFNHQEINFLARTAT
jgi:hypothetical protein